MNKTLDLSFIATTLDESPDYKVLHRLRPLKGLNLKAIDPLIKTARIVLIDTESTGLDPLNDAMIEVGLVAIDVDRQTGGFIRFVGQLSQLEDPGFPLEEHTTKLTGIQDADLAGQKFDEKKIYEFLKGSDLVIAHNSSHDRPFFETRFPDLNDFAWGCSYKDIDWKSLDIGSSKLDYIAFKLGMFYDGHRAIIDCHALGHVLIKAVFPDGETALQKLIQKSSQCEFHVFANYAPFESKDALRLNGYRWDGDNKVWHKFVTEDSINEEFDWLHSEVYGGKSARVSVETLTSRAKFSLNPPEGSIRKELRSIGSQGDKPAMTAGGARKFSGARRY